METRFAICQTVSYFNDSSQKIERSAVQGIKIVPTGIHADEGGNEVLDSHVVLYSLKNGINLTENACFGTDEECRLHYRKLFSE